MFKHILLVGLLLMLAVACASPETLSQPVTAEEEHHDEDEDNHDDEHHDEAKDDHDEEDHDDEDNHETDGEHREHDAHEHGAAELMIAWSGNELAIDLQTPAYNVLGFEYAPTTEAEKTLLAERIAALETGEHLQLSQDANCTLTSATVETELAEEAHEAGEEAHDEDEETHSDIHVAYNIQCQQPDNLESLDASQLFEQFPNFEDLRAQWISDAAQSAKQLTPNDPVLSFK